MSIVSVGVRFSYTVVTVFDAFFARLGISEATRRYVRKGVWVGSVHGFNINWVYYMEKNPDNVMQFVHFLRCAGGTFDTAHPICQLLQIIITGKNLPQYWRYQHFWYNLGTIGVLADSAAICQRLLDIIDEGRYKAPMTLEKQCRIAIRKRVTQVYRPGMIFTKMIDSLRLPPHLHNYVNLQML